MNPRGVVARVRGWLTSPALVLMYHRIATPSRDPWQLAVTPAHFAEHLEVIRRQGAPMSVRDLSRGIGERRVPRRAIVVTLDDGYADNLHQARPLLERHEVPATVFVAAGYLGRAEGFWWDVLERLVLAPATVPARLMLHVRGVPRPYVVSSPESAEERHRLFLDLYELMRPLTDVERQDVLAVLSTWSGVDPRVAETDRPLTVSELRKLARDGLVEIGAHTVTHAQLSALGAEAQEDEIRRSRTLLAEITGQAIVSFAYPYGGPAHFTGETTRLVRGAGFTGACATTAGTVRRTTDPFRIPRVHVEDWDGDALARHLADWAGGRV